MRRAAKNMIMPSVLALVVVLAATTAWADHRTSANYGRYRTSVNYTADRSSVNWSSGYRQSACYTQRYYHSPVTYGRSYGYSRYVAPTYSYYRPAPVVVASPPVIVASPPVIVAPRTCVPSTGITVVIIRR